MQNHYTRFRWVKNSPSQSSALTGGSYLLPTRKQFISCKQTLGKGLLHARLLEITFRRPSVRTATCWLLSMPAGSAVSIRQAGRRNGSLTANSHRDSDSALMEGG